MELQHALVSLRAQVYAPRTPASEPISFSALRSMIARCPDRVLVQYILSLRDALLLDPKQISGLQSETKHATGLLNALPLRGVAWDHIHLPNADLRNTSFELACLVGADLSNANLCDANLRGANLRGANLSGASLIRANLRGTDLREANLSNVNVSGALCDDLTRWPRGFLPQNHTLFTLSRHAMRGADLRAFCLDHQDLSDFDLSETIFPKDTQHAHFKRATLTRANLHKSTFQSCDFTEADFGNTTLGQGTFRDCVFHKAHLRAKFVSGSRPFGKTSSLCNADLSHTNLNTLILQDLDLSKTHLVHSTITHANLSGANLTHANAHGADFAHSTLRNTQLQRSILTYTNFASTDLRGAKLTCANLSGANFRRARLEGADLRGATLYDTDFTGARFDGRTQWPKGLDPTQIEAFGPRADFSNRAEVPTPPESFDLSGANFTNSCLRTGGYVAIHDGSLNGARMRNVYAQGVHFRDVTLSGADLRGADLRGATLVHCRLVCADLRGADLRGAWLYRCHMRGVVYDHETQWPKHFSHHDCVRRK